MAFASAAARASAAAFASEAALESSANLDSTFVCSSSANLLTSTSALFESTNSPHASSTEGNKSIDEAPLVRFEHSVTSAAERILKVALLESKFLRTLEDLELRFGSAAKSFASIASSRSAIISSEDSKLAL